MLPPLHKSTRCCPQNFTRSHLQFGRSLLAPSINLRPICQHLFTYPNKSLTPTFKQLQTLLATTQDVWDGYRGHWVKEVCHVLEDIGFAGFIKRDEEPDAGLTASWSLE